MLAKDQVVMKLKYIIAISVCLLLLVLAIPKNGLPLAPFDIDWNKSWKENPVVETFHSKWGSIESGSVTYLGKLAELDGELHLNFVGNKLSDALIVLGPDGINSRNCISKYNHIVNILKKKYGKPSIKKVLEDPMASELLFRTKCVAVRSGLYELEVTWDLGEYKVHSLIWGDRGDIYIEVAYYHLGNIKNKDSVKLKKLFKSL